MKTKLNSTASGPTSTENDDETFLRLYCAALTGLCAQNKDLLESGGEQ
jgi:hypothetical protein